MTSAELMVVLRALSWVDLKVVRWVATSAERWADQRAVLLAVC